ncbi:MAG: bifunctional homocysteine S-methyltransferase/methylenetetrahydrofolate reductase, partial [Longimicrobiales bacterium]|nr:bifunctional homocysteine S-methyltransferase/methylenetetrahydrofolate reductase [Longimicrobiales bacterium]
IRIEPFGPTSEDEARAYFRRQIQGLADGGVDGFVLETFTDLEEIRQALRAAREVSPELPVVAQMTVSEDGATSYGTTVEQIAASLTEWEADVVGLNCSVGPASMLEALERMAEATDLPLSAQPNAGMPRTVGDRKIYLASPEYMAQYARRLSEAGARFVGGCCGTSPGHIARMAEAVSSLQPKIHHARVRALEPDEGRGTEPAPLSERSAWGRKLAGDGWLTSVELTPPRGWNAGGIVESARRAREAGVDVVYLTETARGQSRMGVIPAATVVQSSVDVETVIHYTCRDRNMLGMISDLLGAAAAGLRNLVVVSGDPTVTGPYKDATAVFDIDSIGLVNVLQGLNRGVDPGGSPIDEPTRWVVGVSVNPVAVDRERELERWFWKVDAGADFALCEPIFDPRALEAFLSESEAPRIPIIAQVPVLTSSRDAEFLAHEVPGTAVPEAVVERMKQAERGGNGAVRAEGIAIARETVDALRPVVRGVQLRADGDVDAALEALATD